VVVVVDFLLLHHFLHHNVQVELVLMNEIQLVLMQLMLIHLPKEKIIKSN
jgi:hypothetical protein